jgi:hypothetical protein
MAQSFGVKTKYLHKVRIVVMNASPYFIKGEIEQLYSAKTSLKRGP